MNAADALLCLKLHSIPGLSDTLLTRLLLHFGSPEAVWESRRDGWSSLGVAPEVIAVASSHNGRESLLAEPQGQLESLQQLGARVIAITDKAYPALLHTIYDPPPILYLLGDATLLQQAQIAVVGSRKASPAGLRAARTLSGQLVTAGLHICSGLALGIDAEAHRAALNAGGQTIAVMATGIDRVYPAHHRCLAKEIAQHGALVTEYPPGCKPERYRFPRRNRILSGLSLGVLVVEAALRSGSLITAGTALEQGREVFTLPWAMFHVGGRGCLRLLRDGVTMVESVDDILAELGPLYTLQQDLAREQVEAAAGQVPLGQRQISDLIGYESVSVDELVHQSALPVARVMAALSELELRGVISRSSGGYIHC